MQTRRRRLLANAAALALTATLTACAGDGEPTTARSDQATVSGEGSSSADPAAHDDAETQFAQMMVVHHQGAVEMAQRAAQKASTDAMSNLPARL